MYILENIAAEEICHACDSPETRAARGRLKRTLNDRQRRLLLRLDDATDSLLSLTARDNYIRGVCMGLAFAERFYGQDRTVYRPK